MDEETSRLIVIGGMAVGVAVWLGAVLTMARVARERRAMAERGGQRFEIEGATGPGLIVGEAEVEGRPEDLAEKLAASLSREGMGPLGPVKILGCSPRAVEFESAGAGSIGFRKGRIQLDPSGSKTVLAYAIEEGRRPAILMAIGWILIGLGPVVLLAAAWLMSAYVLPSPNPAVRGQAIQILQVLQFLWPPFLFASLARASTRTIRARFEAMLHNLPYA